MLDTMPIKNERIEFRITSEDKELLKRAQELSGDTSFTNFLIRIAKKESEAIVSEYETILKSNEDKELFFKIVTSDADPGPNEALASAGRLFDELFDEA
jgi:Uncharacterized protein conserved in bacteria